VRILDYIEVVDGVCQFRPRGECSLVEAVELIGTVIKHCRDCGIAKLLVNGTGLVGVSVPSLVDRFLLIEEWAQKANKLVIVVLVVHAEYIHPQKFGVKVAADFGMVTDVYTSEAHALEWLANVGSAAGPEV
jgi:hypothetical protein